MTHDEETRASIPQERTEPEAPAFWNEPEPDLAPRRGPSRALVFSVALAAVLVLALALGTLALTRGKNEATPPPAEPSVTSSGTNSRPSNESTSATSPSASNGSDGSSSSSSSATTDSAPPIRLA